jgi:hypothetical protein
MIEGGRFTSLSKCAKTIFNFKIKFFYNLEKIKYSIMDDQNTILNTRIWGNFSRHNH